MKNKKPWLALTNREHEEWIREDKKTSCKAKTKLQPSDIYNLVEQAARANSRVIQIPPNSDLSGMKTLPHLAEGWLYRIGPHSLLPPHLHRSFVGYDCTMPDTPDHTHRIIRECIILHDLRVDTDPENNRRLKIRHSIVNNLSADGTVDIKTSVTHSLEAHRIRAHESLLIDPLAMEETLLSTQNIVLAPNWNRSTLYKARIVAALNLIHEKAVPPRNIQTNDLAATNSHVIKGVAGGLDAVRRIRKAEQVDNPAEIIARARREVTQVLDLSPLAQWSAKIPSATVDQTPDESMSMN